MQRCSQKIAKLKRFIVKLKVLKVPRRSIEEKKIKLIKKIRIGKTKTTITHRTSTTVKAETLVDRKII